MQRTTKNWNFKSHFIGIFLRLKSYRKQVESLIKLVNSSSKYDLKNKKQKDDINWGKGLLRLKACCWFYNITIGT